jgi:hypothetical protein
MISVLLIVRKETRMKIVNLTKHDLTIAVGGRDIVIPPSGQVATVTTSSVIVDILDVGGDAVPVYKTVFGDVVGLPDPQPDTIYIASTLVASRAGRTDVLAPDTGASAIRKDGQVVAVTQLQTF